MAPIKIPKTPARAYNDQRQASDLLRAHVENLEKAVRGSRTRSAIGRSLTEAEAARYIRELSRQLHQDILLPQVSQAPTVGQRPSRGASSPKSAVNASRTATQTKRRRRTAAPRKRVRR
jgi:hypothetical protein